MMDDMEYYRRQFYIEAKEILEKATEDVLRAEAEPENTELLNSIFRGIHTIKGSAGGFELGEISEFTHYLESLLDRLRKREIELSPDIVDLILNGIDHIGKMIEQAEAGRKPEIDYDLVEKFKSFAGKKVDKEISREKPAKKEPLPEISSVKEEVPSEIKEHLKDYLKKGYKIYKVVVKYSTDEFINGYDPLVFLKNLKGNTVFYQAITEEKVPSLSEFDPLSLYLQPVVYIATEMSVSEIEELTFDESLIDVVELDALEETPALPFEQIDAESIKEFMIDAEEIAETLEKNILSYEKERSVEALNAIFRAIHNLKGDAAYIGLKVLAQFCHKLETLLEKLRRGKIEASSTIVDILLKGVDIVRQTIECLKTQKSEYPSHFKEVEVLLERILSGEEVSPEEVQVAKVLPSEDVLQVFFDQISQFKEILGLYTIRGLKEENLKIILRTLRSLKASASYIKLFSLCQLVENALSLYEEKKLELFEKELKGIEAFIEGLLSGGVKKLGEILIEDKKIIEKDLQDALSKQKKLGEILVDEGKIKKEELDEALQKQRLMEKGAQLRPKIVSKGEEIKTMRVEERKIDALTNLIGELVVVRNTYEYLLNSLSNLPQIDRQIFRAFKDNFYQLTRLSYNLQESVMSLRMIPIKNVFQRFHRVVRDIARKEGKKIRLITEGEETEIDKKVADMLADPLIHLVRNACDHGIETSEERKAKGKPEEGTVLLNASQEGSNIVIKVIDDGRGIDRKRLFEKAKERGFSFDSPDDPGLLNVIFMPGFSTKDKATDISGRGVGMDVVKTTVESLGGKVYLQSEEGWGTELTLIIPTSIGITSALLIEDGGKTFAIPIDYVLETLKVSASEVRRIHDRIGIYYRGTVLPCEKLFNLLYQKERTCKLKSNRVSEVPIIVLKIRTGNFGILVDKLLRKTEIAIKPVPEVLSGIDIVSGVSIMGDGKVVLVLNPEKLV
jgi:two-component system chemotaxis sensor kinase CheA